MQRCRWCNLNNPLYIKYHDEEWGTPTYDDKELFELLILESFQAGLSWECVLNKRENFRKAYDNFDIDKIINYDEAKINELKQNPGIIRNKLKIKASINNAKIFKEIGKEYGSFSKYIWGFTNNKIIYEIGKTSSELSDKISKDLKKQGMTFVGTTIIYAYLQAIGIVNSHDKTVLSIRKEIKMDNINKIINLTTEYIDQISSDGRVTGGLIKFINKNIDNKETLAMDIYVFQTSFIRHFNTHISDGNTFINKLKEKIKDNYSKSKDYKIKIADNKIEITRIRKEAKPCTLTITYDK